MLENALHNFGLNGNEIRAYLTLLKMGPNRASTLAGRLSLPRTTMQNILNRMETNDLVTKTYEKNAIIYAPSDPKELIQILEAKKRRQTAELDSNIQELKKVMPELTGMMLANKHVPGVKFYRGKEGMRRVLFDTLTSKTELKDFANIDAMFEHFQEVNDEYVSKREKTKVTKRSLLLDTPFAREVYESGAYSPKSHKGYKWINAERYPFVLEMNIYDGKVSYLTYAEDDFVGVIIENQYIYEMHDSMWNMIWDSLPDPH
jgi:predicted transcriptional regulator